MARVTYIQALNKALAAEMKRDPAVCVLGEDIGAALTGFTRGLRDRFGTDRVMDVPLSEQAFTGFATGAAMSGWRPVIEFQIPSLLFLVFEQIANQAHKFSLMTGGQTRVPVTYVLPGAGSRVGWAGQHSDQPHALFAHVGIKTVVPATPADAYGLLLSAIRDDDPVLLLAPAPLLRTRQDIPAHVEPVPIGSARVASEGSDVTVVAIGQTVPDALSVASRLAGQVSVEVLDPRTVYPFDWAALAESVGKTGRLVVADDGNKFCGLAAEILATAGEDLRLLSPARRVTRPDGAVMPFALELDRALQPGEEDLMNAVLTVMKHDSGADVRRPRAEGAAP
jgi:pyruvate dehydrogenase E1 component beta subunit